MRGAGILTPNLFLRRVEEEADVCKSRAVRLAMPSISLRQSLLFWSSSVLFITCGVNCCDVKLEHESKSLERGSCEQLGAGVLLPWEAPCLLLPIPVKRTGKIGNKAGAVLGEALQLAAGGKEEAAFEFRAALGLDKAGTLQAGVTAVGSSGEQCVVPVGVSGGTDSCH